MIKCDLGKVTIQGPEVVVLAELSTLLGNMKDVIAEKHGEDYAKGKMQEVWNSAFLSEEELKSKIKDIEKQLPPELVVLADMLVKRFGGATTLALAM